MSEKSLVRKMADRFGVDDDKLLATLKDTAFQQKEGVEITSSQMMALFVVADQYKLNPFTRELYAFPDKKGIVPIVSVDGWSRIINEHPEFDGMTFNYSENMVVDDSPEEKKPKHKPCPEWCEVVCYRKDRSHPIPVREYFDEVYRPPFKGGNYWVAGPWQTHTKRMLRHKALIQAARLAFGFAGIYDKDEAERIIDGQFTVNAEDRASDLQRAIEEDALPMAGNPEAPAIDAEEVMTPENKEFIDDLGPVTEEAT